MSSVLLFFMDGCYICLPVIAVLYLLLQSADAAKAANAFTDILMCGTYFKYCDLLF